MKIAFHKTLTNLCFFAAVLLIGCHAEIGTKIEDSESSKLDEKLAPNMAEAWKWSYPESTWDPNEASRKWENVERWIGHHPPSQGNRIIEGEWRNEGPNNIGGRFNFIRQHPTEPFKFYAGSSTGGLWVTSGDNEWTCLTENLAAMSNGDLVFHEEDARDVQKCIAPQNSPSPWRVRPSAS